MSVVAHGVSFGWRQAVRNVKNVSHDLCLEPHIQGWIKELILYRLVFVSFANIYFWDKRKKSKTMEPAKQ